jgi:hypothetical protein
VREVNGCSVPPQAGIQLSLVVVVCLFIESLDYQSGLGLQEEFLLYLNNFWDGIIAPIFDDL